MNITRTDAFVVATLLSTMWLLWRIVDVVTLGAGFALLGSASILGWTTIAILVGASFCIFSILMDGMKYVAGALEGKGGGDTALAGHLPKLLALVGMYIALLVVQALWYMWNGY